MYLPRDLISHLYTHLTKTHHALSPPVLLLVSLDPDALCACRILTALFRRDYIPHKIQPVSGYGDFARAGEELVRPMRTTEGGAGGVVVCLGVGGLVDVEAMLGLEVDEDGNGGMGGVDVWVIDARRPWNLSNVFGTQSLTAAAPQEGQLVPLTPGVEKGRVSSAYRPGRGGVFVFDDGDIVDELQKEGEAYCALAEMPELGEDDDEESEDEEEEDEEGGVPESDVEDEGPERIPDSAQPGQKRKSPSQEGMEDESDADEGTPRKRRRSNSNSSIDTTPERPARRGLMITSRQRSVSDPDTLVRSDSPSSALPGSPATTHQPSARQLRRQLLKLRRKHDKVISEYQNLGTSYSEPISSLMYSLASELGREDNDLLWQAIVGVSSLELSGRTSQGVGLVPVNTSGTTSSWTRDRGERIRSVLRDEVRRLNPTDLKDIARIESMGDANGIIQTHARSPNDNSIRLSPEPRLLLVRHWSLYDSMRHSPFLGAKLHIWSESGRKRLNKFLAKMGISLSQSKQNYTHMDMQLKRDLRERLLKYAPVYGLDGLVPPQVNRGVGGKEGWGFVRCWGWKACLSALDAGVILGAILEVGDMNETLKAALDMPPPLARNPNSGRETPRTQEEPSPQTDAQASESAREEALTKRFWAAYDALSNVSLLTSHIATAQHLYRAILRTGASLLEKKQICHLRAFRMAVVKDGPDVQLFTHPGALTKLALWVSEAVAEVEGSKGRKGGELVMAGLDEERGVYTVVGLGGGSGVVKQRELAARKAEKRRERERKREERAVEKARKKTLRRERVEANGEEWDSDLEEEDETEDESESSASESESEDEAEGGNEGRGRGRGLNRFGLAFAEAVEQTGARVRQDSFEHSVVELKKEDLGGFLEALSLKAVVG